MSQIFHHPSALTQFGKLATQIYAVIHFVLHYDCFPNTIYCIDELTDPSLSSPLKGFLRAGVFLLHRNGLSPNDQFVLVARSKAWLSTIKISYHVLKSHFWVTSHTPDKSGLLIPTNNTCSWYFEYRYLQGWKRRITRSDIEINSYWSIWKWRVNFRLTS